MRRFIPVASAYVICIASVMLTVSLRGQETQVATEFSDETARLPDTNTVTANPDCNGTRFNLEPRANAISS
jgi:hypothetical protein